MDLIRVLLVEDHPHLRQLLQGFLAEDPAISVVGEAETCQEALPKSDRRRLMLSWWTSAFPAVGA
ncbi:MAG: hypothetical protein Q8R28_18560, partial [Dehalococcoidia bacterium]|nr:hypothetical protein [Dehalococcoidia bacterium]